MRKFLVETKLNTSYSEAMVLYIKKGLLEYCLGNVVLINDDLLRKKK